MKQDIVIPTGAKVSLTRRNARVWLGDSGEQDHLEIGTAGTVTAQRSPSTVVVDFSETRWVGRPVIVRVAELEEV